MSESISINVKGPSELKLNLKVDPTVTVRALKEQIQAEKPDFPADRWEFSGGIRMNEDKENHERFSTQMVCTSLRNGSQKNEFKIKAVDHESKWVCWVAGYPFAELLSLFLVSASISPPSISHSQRLIYSGKVLKDEETVASYNVKDNRELSIELSLIQSHSISPLFSNQYYSFSSLSLYLNIYPIQSNFISLLPTSRYFTHGTQCFQICTFHWESNLFFKSSLNHSFYCCCCRNCSCKRRSFQLCNRSELWFGSFGSVE